MTKTASHAARVSFFDASALAKVFAQEPGSEIIRPYFESEPTKYTTQFCFYEALNVLKNSRLPKDQIKPKAKNKTQLSQDEYLSAANRLFNWFRTSSRNINDIEFTKPETFAEAQRIAAGTGLDLSDAFQILSVKSGYFSPLCGDSATVLVTADKGLSIAARAEGLRVWYFMSEAAP